MESREIGPYLTLYKLGEGASSIVYYGIHKATQNPVSIKVINLLETGKQPIDEDKIEQEIAIMRKIDHPYIVKLYDVIRNQEMKQIYLILELAANGTLEAFLRCQPIHVAQAKKYFCQICHALSYLHNTMKIVHRDIKSENVLISGDFEAKLSDFGFSRHFNSSSQDDLMTTRCGSPMYVSPELIMGHGYTEKTDIWSMGILLYYMVTGFYPFADDNIQRLFQKIVKMEPFFPPEVMLDEHLVDLISMLLQKNPDCRPSIDDVIGHPWLQGVSPKPVNSKILPAASSVMNIRPIHNRIIPCVSLPHHILNNDMIKNSYNTNNLNRIMTKPIIQPAIQPVKSSLCPGFQIGLQKRMKITPKKSSIGITIKPKT